MEFPRLFSYPLPLLFFPIRLECWIVKIYKIIISRKTVLEILKVFSSDRNDIITLQIKPALGKLFASSIKLTDQLRMLDQDMIRLQQKVNVVLEYKATQKILEDAKTLLSSLEEVIVNPLASRYFVPAAIAILLYFLYRGTKPVILSFSFFVKCVGSHPFSEQADLLFSNACRN